MELKNNAQEKKLLETQKKTAAKQSKAAAGESREGAGIEGLDAEDRGGGDIQPEPVLKLQHLQFQLLKHGLLTTLECKGMKWWICSSNPINQKLCLS